MLKHPRVSVLNWVGIGIGILCLYFSITESYGLVFHRPMKGYYVVFVLHLITIPASLALICGILSEYPLLMLPELIVLALYVGQSCPFISVERLYIGAIKVILGTIFMVAIYVLYNRTRAVLRERRTTVNKGVLQYIPTTDTPVVRDDELQKMNAEPA